MRPTAARCCSTVSRRRSTGPRMCALRGSRRCTSLAVLPALNIASNLYLGREERRAGVLGSVFRMLDTKGIRTRSAEQVQTLGTTRCKACPSRSVSGGQRQAIAVARAAAFGSKVVLLDEPTAALGVRESSGSASARP